MNDYPSIIGLTGKRGAGKTTTAELAIQLTGLDWERLRFAGKLKNFIADWLGGGVTPRDLDRQEVKDQLIPELGITVGRLLQVVGEGLRELVHPDFHVIGTMRGLEAGKRYVCEDVRYPNEADAIQARGGVVWRVTGDPLKQQGNGKRDDAAPSEVALDNREFPVLRNHGAKVSLRAQLANFLRKVRLGQRLALPSERADPVARLFNDGAGGASGTW